MLRRRYVVGREITRISLVVVLAVFTQTFGLLSLETAQAQIAYGTIGSSYTQNFDTLPNNPTNTSLGTTPNGWTDDNAAPGAGNFSIPGWYLYHGTTQATEGGFNQHQRMRAGIGSQNTGGFWSYGAVDDTDRALSSLGSSTTTPQNIALRLTNNTGSVLGQFTLSYTGEQWRDGGAAVPNAQTLSFGYAVTPNASPPANIGALSINNFSGLTFTSPTFTNTGSGTALNGNDTANKTAISATVAGFTWNPGEDLWLRWNHPDAAGNDHGLGIDDLTFSANVPVEVNSAQTGLASVGTTWSDGQPAGAGKGYHVINGHTVTLDGAFLGSKLSVENGTVNINSSGSGQFFGAMTIESGGNLTESVVGNVSIGDSTASGLKLNRDVAFNLDPNSTFQLKALLTGPGNLDFNETSPGNAVNSEVNLDSATGITTPTPSGYSGIVRFNAGKQVNVTESAGLNTIEMNSAQSGGNILNYGPKLSTSIQKLTFNQPGTFIHSTNNPIGTAGQRTTNLPLFVVNAPITVDMSQTLFIEERRLLVSDFQGSGNILVKGTPTDPTNPGAGSTGPNFTGITLNEFEVGAQGTDPSAGSSEPYAGTISTQDYINVEIRRNLPGARFVVNDKGRMETGGQDIPLPVNAGTTIGEIQVNSGGVLEVGFEQANTNTVANGGNSVEGHHVNHLNLVSNRGRNGSLTLTGGATPSTLRMQINGTNQATEYDYINAHGTVSLAGTLDVLVNPVSCEGNDPCGGGATTPNPVWTPALDETFNIINITATIPAGDYDGNGTVNNADLDAWRATFGNTVTAGSGTDGNNNAGVDAADYVIWRNNLNQTGGITGAITGTFSNINIVDPNGALANQGLTLQAIYTSTAVQLKVVSAGSGSAVPEPTTLFLLVSGCGLASLLRRRHN